MIIVYCKQPFSKNEVDHDYLEEYHTARDMGIKAVLLDFEALVYDNNVGQSLRSIPDYNEIVKAVYRGWMLKPEIYDLLYNALLKKNIKLINAPVEYRHCHHLPNSYKKIEGRTPKSVWFEIDRYENNFNGILEELKIFGDNPIMVKDYVKSRKHEWRDACYISSASNHSEVKRVTKNFVERQGKDINVGLVYRQFVQLEFMKNHSKSNMPLTKEYRLFVKDQKPMYVVNYWDEGTYDDEELPLGQFEDIFLKISSSFFTIDIAKATTGEWIIIEVGDAQVSGIPDNANVREFYNGLID